ncbi:hypothetical protein AGMMS4952_22650 [Spirochaetia bacterium]|nr:hypothetical protein AGMMS4952_22650 [Spirochaetia bacterium]
MKKNFFIGAVFMVLAAAAFAQTEADFDVTLTDDGTGVVIKNFTGKAPKIGAAWQVTIPATIQGMPVKEIAENAFSRSTYSERGLNNQGSWVQTTQGMTSVIIPEGLIKIGYSAFGLPQSINGSPTLTSITIPASVTEIGVVAFQGSLITSITLPAGLTKLGAGAFQNCTTLKNITIPEGITEIPEGMLEGCKAITSITLSDNIRSIGSGAFSGTSIVSFTWPGSVPVENIFRDGLLETIVFAEGVTEIEYSAFKNYNKLTSVTFPSTIKEIKSSAFYGCSSLTTVTIPDSVETIEFEWDAFSGCSKLTLATQAALKRRGYKGHF